MRKYVNQKTILGIKFPSLPPPSYCRIRFRYNVVIDSFFIINFEMMSVVYNKQLEAVCDISELLLLKISLLFLNMENSITANDTLTSYGVLETLGLLFYVASPSGTSYERIEECPDFVNQVKQGFQLEENHIRILTFNKVIPYIVILIILEAIINHFHRGRPQNLADSVTSISSGLLMTAGGLVTRVAMVRSYEHIYQVCETLSSFLHFNIKTQEHRLLDLPWDSPLTWLCTALLLDLGYYWFHRASHEVGVLWAVHQVR